MRAGGHVFVGHLVAEHIGPGQLAVGGIVHVLQQLHHGHAALAETGDNQGPAGLALSEEVVEGVADILHGQARALMDDILVARQKRLDGRVPVVRRPIAVARCHIRGCLVHLDGHVRAVLRIPDIGKMDGVALCVCPVLFPGGHHIEDVGSGTLRVHILRYPHGGIGVVRSRRYRFLVPAARKKNQAYNCRGQGQSCHRYNSEG